MLDVIVPVGVAQRFVRVAPADDKSTVALADRIADQRILRLQVQDVVLVDARRHQQEGSFMHLGRGSLYSINWKMSFS